MGGGKGGGSSGPKKLSTRSDSNLNKIKSSGTIQYSSTERPVGVAFHNGRVFYFGLDIFGQPAVYFSQLLTDTSKAGLCFQEADPTAQEINDLVATDGGVLRPVGMGSPVAIKESPFGVLCFCRNGVWIVRGPEGSGFSATNFQTSKVTDKGALGAQSIVEAAGAILYFSEDSIIQLAPDEFGRIQATDLTSDSIDSIYKSFSKNDHKHAKGIYVDSEKRVYWSIPNTAAGEGGKNSATFLLVLSTNLPGFYQWSVSSPTGGGLLLPFENRAFAPATTFERLTTTDGVTEVTTAAGAVITSNKVELSEGDVIPMFLASRSTGGGHPIEVYHPTSVSFLDFGAEDYTSFVEFGYQYPASKAVGLAAPYIHSFFSNRRIAPTPASSGVCQRIDLTSAVLGADVLSVAHRGAGLHMYPGGLGGIYVTVNGTGIGTLVSFTTSTPYQLDNITITGSFNLATTGAPAGSVFVHSVTASDDGRWVWLMESSSTPGDNYDTHTLELLTPGNAASATLRSVTPLATFGGLDNVDMWMSPDGTVAYVLAWNAPANNIGKFVLSVPYDISTAVQEGTFIDTSDVMSQAHSIDFAPGLKTMYLLDTSASAVRMYETPDWQDPATWFYSGLSRSFDVEVANAHQMRFSDDGHHFYIGSWNTKQFFRFSMGCL